MGKYPRLHPQVAARVMDGQALVILADTGEVNVFNPVGTRIWELIDGRHSVTQIIEAITSEYEITEAEASKDVQGFVQELLDARAITLEEQPAR